MTGRNGAEIGGATQVAAREIASNVLHGTYQVRTARGWSRQGATARGPAWFGMS
jgi:hypothetical protein